MHRATITGRTILCDEERYAHQQDISGQKSRKAVVCCSSLQITALLQVPSEIPRCAQVRAQASGCNTPYKGDYDVRVVAAELQGAAYLVCLDRSHRSVCVIGVSTAVLERIAVSLLLQTMLAKQRLKYHLTCRSLY
jgi:hypothetical protein